jgi:hypothetical protein
MPVGESSSPHPNVAAGLRWTAPPNWEAVPPDWAPTADWRPDPSWGPPPPGWAFLRLSDCAADAGLPPVYRDVDLDEKLRTCIGNPAYSAHSFVHFLREITDLVDAAFKLTGEARPVGLTYREVAARSVSDASDVLTRAERRGEAVPFVFFACIQDAVSALNMFAADTEHSGADGQDRTGLATFPDSGFTAEEPSFTTASPQQEAHERFQVVLDATVTRVLAVLREALRQSQLGGRRGAAARKALENSDEVKRLIQRAGSGTIALSEGLRLVERLDRIGRRIAAAIATRY